MAGGAEQVMHEHMKGWVEAGCEVTLFTSHFLSGFRQEIIDGVKIIRRGRQILGVHIAAAWWYIFLRHEKYDLVVDQFHGIPFFTPLYVRVPKLAVVQEVARKVWFKNDLPWLLNYLIGILGYVSEPFIFKLYRSIQFLTGSQSAKDDLVRMGIKGDKITIIHHGVIIEKIKVPKKEKNPTVVFLGALAKDKGIEEAIKAFSMLSKSGVFKFWIIGRGGESYVEKLKKMVRKKGIDGSTKFWGFVSQKKKFELLARAQVMINPSILEGWGLVNIEANAMGMPVVAYQSPGLVDSVSDGKSGILCKTNTVGEMVKEIENLIQDREKYKRLQKGAKEWSNRFSWEQSKKESVKLISGLVRYKKYGT